MAGTYTKKDFSSWPEEQTLLKDSNGTRIMPKGSEPVRLSPGWEGTGVPDDELNFKGVTMDQADLELNPPKDRLKTVYLIMVLHGVGVLTSWNMFITAQSYFVDFKLSANYTGEQNNFITNFPVYVGFASQIPNLLFNWINVFIQFGGNLNTRIVWGIFIQVVIFIFTVILAMIDSSTWPTAFFWITMVSVVIMNTANGIYQNSVFGMAAKLPIKYTGAVVLGSNISGTLTAVISFLSLVIAPNHRTAAIYYFITAIFILLACFDTYFALPINRFYRYHELLFEKEKKKMESSNTSIPYFKIFRKCSIQLFNIFFVFFVTLTVFPGVHGSIKKSDPNFFVIEDYYPSVMCFLTFNITAMLGSLLASFVQWPKKKYLIIFVVLRTLFIPLFLMCNFQPLNLTRIMPVYINNDWVYFVIAVAMGLTNGYFSSLGMMYCPREVEPKHAATAGMFGAAALITGVFSGLMFASTMPSIVTNWSFDSIG